MNIADKLRKVLEIKNNIKAALEEKGIENVSNDFSTFAESIANIKGGGGEPEEPEIPGIPEIPTEPWVQPEDWIDLRTVLAENEIEGYPYRIAQLVYDNLPTSTFNCDYYSETGCKVRTSDGFDYDVAPGTKIEHAWTFSEDNYRWVIHYYPEKTNCFANVLPDCVHLLFDSIRVIGLVYLTTNSTAQLFNAYSSDFYLSLKAIETINGGKLLGSNGKSDQYPYYRGLFKQCYSLEYISNDIFELEHIGNCTSFEEMFSECYLLKSIPELNTSNGTNFKNMFNACYILESVPLIDTSKGTDFSSMFYSCHSLKSIPELNTSNGTNFSGMFNGCYSLESVPLIDTSKGTSFDSMFNNCYSLKSIPLIDTIKGTSFSSMFYSCYLLKSIPLIDTSKGVYFSSMFCYCHSLKSIPLIDTSKGTGFNSMFEGCRSLVTIPELNTSNGTNFSKMFYSCNLLKSIPELNTSNGIDFSGMFYGCDSLVTIPELDTSNGINFKEMFSQCDSLVTVPELNTSKGTNFEKMFYYCRSLRFIPNLDTSKGTTFYDYINYLWGSPIKEVRVNISSCTRTTTLFDSYCSNIESVIITIGNNFKYTLNLRNTYGTYLKIIGNIQSSLTFGSYLSIFEIDGSINYNLNFSSAKRLTKQSLLNILNALVPQEEGTTKTLTLGSDNLAKLSDEEIAIATSKGWTVS